MTLDDDEQPIDSWELQQTSVYGAMIAVQVMEYQRAGRGAPTTEDMVRFVDEAWDVVGLHDQAYVLLEERDKREDQEQRRKDLEQRRKKGVRT